MKCQSCYWYNPQADGSGCVQGHDVPPQGCPDFHEDWDLLAQVSPTDPRLGMAVRRVHGGEWCKGGGAGPEYEAGDDSAGD